MKQVIIYVTSNGRYFAACLGTQKTRCLQFEITNVWGGNADDKPTVLTLLEL